MPAPAVPAIIVSLMAALAYAMESIVGRVLIALGIGMVTFTGITTGLDAIKTVIWSNLEGVGASFMSAAAVMKVDVCISMLFAAYAARLGLTLVSGSVTKFQLTRRAGV